MIDAVARAALSRIGIDPRSDDFLAALVPFVIDRESLHTIGPLAAVPADYDTDTGCASPDRRFETLRYRNVALPPVPVLSASLAPLLVADPRGVDLELVDGHNVYGANRFERDEGRRLLRRAIGYVYECLAEDGVPFDIIAFDADGFLIARPKAAAAPPLKARLQRIIAAMHGDVRDPCDRRTIGDRLATFYKQARGAVLAPALLACEPRDDLQARVGRRGISRDDPLEVRFSRLQSRHPALAAFLDAVRARPLHEQNTLVALVEHRMFDAVLEPLAEAFSRQECGVRACRDPRELLNGVPNRPVTFCRVELLSLLKSLNDDPRGGFAAGNAALTALYSFLVTAIQQSLQDASSGRRCVLLTFRRWGEFYFAVDGDAGGGAPDLAAVVERAFERTRYLTVDCRRRGRTAVYSASVASSCPEGAPARIVVPMIPAITPDMAISGDIMAIPMEQPASTRRAIADRLRTTEAPQVDVAFLADWTLNACDAKRGIPRLVEILGATPDDVTELSEYYRPATDRRGRLRYELNRDAEAIAGVTAKLRALSA